jgi:hygromycin-B 7''-O-kinase
MGDRTLKETGYTYTARLGKLTPQQFQAALLRFGLGDFVEARPIAQGLFGQNVFVTSTTGQYVFRGKPHFHWQFPKERFGATLLHGRTSAPVAYPYLFDPTTEIFGWSYLFMPRMPGISPTESQLTYNDRLDVARAMGRNLAEMHTLTWDFAGHYDFASDTIQSFSEGFARWVISDVHSWRNKAEKHGAITTGDSAWIEQIVRDAQSALTVAFQPCFVMNDYNLNNVVIGRVRDEWRVTGLFDLMEYYFGDGEADLVRLTAIYLDEEQPYGTQLAQAFSMAYVKKIPVRSGFAERYKLYMLRDRLIVWEYGKRPGVGWFPAAWSFRDYAERYMVGYRLLGI